MLERTGIPGSSAATASTVMAARNCMATRFCFRNSAMPGANAFATTFLITSPSVPKANVSPVTTTMWPLILLRRTHGGFVADGAVFVTQGCYEPTLTIMAIAARAGEHIAQSFRRGGL